MSLCSPFDGWKHFFFVQTGSLLSVLYWNSLQPPTILNAFWRVHVKKQSNKQNPKYSMSLKQSAIFAFSLTFVLSLCVFLSSPICFLPPCANFVLHSSFSPAYRFRPCQVLSQRHPSFQEGQRRGRRDDQLHATRGFWRIVQPYTSLWYLQVQEHWTRLE